MHAAAGRRLVGYAAAAQAASAQLRVQTFTRSRTSALERSVCVTCSHACRPLRHAWHTNQRQVFYLGYAGLKQVDLSDDQVVAAVAADEWEDNMRPVQVRAVAARLDCCGKARKHASHHLSYVCLPACMHTPKRLLRRRRRAAAWRC